MIEGISLTCGKRPDAPALKLDKSAAVTIFVGPNNCGKSALLEAIYKALTEVGRTTKRSALDAVKILPFSRDILQLHPAFCAKEETDICTFAGQTMQLKDWIPMLENQWEEGHYPKTLRHTFCILMNGAKRLTMLPDERAVNLSEPGSPLARLLVEDDRRALFQTAVFTGIGQFPIIDTMRSYGSLSLTFSAKKPDPKVERSLDNDLRSFLKETMLAEDASDGFNAYVGMLGALYASDYKVILIDEPEAFLHPALARTLGKQIAQNATDQKVFIATHSAEFLMGAVESGVPVQIVRLQHQDGISTACLLDSIELKDFMYDPLLRSANTLSGLFSRSVVVTEADADRAFYQEINTRLLTAKDARGIDNALFLNANGKATVPRIVGLLRKMGVPCIGVVDLDVVNQGGRPWSAQATGIGIPDGMRASLEVQRATTFESLKEVSHGEKKDSYKREGGINLLDGRAKENAEDLLGRLAQYGLMVVPTGELEAWLPELDIARSKNSWLNQIFEKMGAEKSDAGYVAPSTGDVWDFIGECNKWLTSPGRKGMST